MNYKNIKEKISEIEVDNSDVHPKYGETVYSVYVLINNGKPIYIGCSESVETRIITHKKTKDFDEVMICGVYSNKATAMFHERVLIDYGMYFNKDVLNIRREYIKRHSFIKMK